MVLHAETFKIIYTSALRPRSPRDPRKIISITPNPPNTQLQCQMMRSQLNQLPLLSTSNQGMMMVQPQPSLCQNSNLMTLLEGPFYYPLETMGRDYGQKSPEKWLKILSRQMEKESKNSKLEEIISYTQLVDHLEAAANEDNDISDDLYKFRALIGHQGPLKPTDPQLERMQV